MGWAQLRSPRQEGCAPASNGRQMARGYDSTGMPACGKYPPMGPIFTRFWQTAPILVSKAADGGRPMEAFTCSPAGLQGGQPLSAEIFGPLTSGAAGSTAQVV